MRAQTRGRNAKPVRLVPARAELQTQLGKMPRLSTKNLDLTTHHDPFKKCAAGT